MGGDERVEIKEHFENYGPRNGKIRLTMPTHMVMHTDTDFFEKTDEKWIVLPILKFRLKMGICNNLR